MLDGERRQCRWGAGEMLDGERGGSVDGGGMQERGWMERGGSVDGEMVQKKCWMEGRGATVWMMKGCRRDKDREEEIVVIGVMCWRDGTQVSCRVEEEGTWGGRQQLQERWTDTSLSAELYVAEETYYLDNVSAQQFE